MRNYIFNNFSIPYNYWGI